MGRKLLNEVDGFVVDEYAATFTGSFEVRGADAKYLAYDDEVLVVVRARVKPPRLKEMKNGDIVRVNVLAVHEGGVVRSDQLKEHLCDTLGLGVPDPQLTFEDALVSIDGGQREHVPHEEIGVGEPEEDLVDVRLQPEDEMDVEIVQSSAPPSGPIVQKFRADGDLPTKGPREAGNAALAAFLATEGP